MKLKKRINPEVQRKLKDAFFVGRLANDDELSLTFFSEPVHYKDELRENIQFLVKCLSPLPDELSNHFYYPNKIIMGSTVSTNNFHKLSEWMQYDRLPHWEVKEKVRDFLEDKLIVFQLSCTNEYVYVELVKVEDVKPAEKGYAIIPGPSLRLDEDRHDFEQKLAGIRRPVTLRYYPNIFELPEYIYYQGTLYNVSLKKSLNATTYTQEESNEVRYLAGFDDEFIDMVDTRIDEDLYFIPAERLLDIRDRVDEHGQSLNLKLEYEHSQEMRAGDARAEAVSERADGLAMEDEPQLYKFNKGEREFLKRLKENARKRQLYFKDEDLYAFHISVKTNLLTIIGGMSGTGKSQLAQLYGETMGLDAGKELLMIPVSPSYHEPNDVLGYLNPTTGVYHESETGLVRLLLEAEESPEKMYMVIFDEMNLSQVEHWFSPFISLLELDPEKRFLTLFNENSFCVNHKYKPKVKIGDNIIFVGTVNFDETTKAFSDRLLDRTNVIVPTKLTFKESLEIAKVVPEKADIDPYNVHTSMFRKDWINDRQAALDVFTPEEVELLDELHQLLHQDDIQKGVSFRMALGIARFLANIPVDEDGTLLISRGQAFDRQIEQRILTKVKGFESYVKPLVGTFSDGEYKEGAIAALLRSEKAQKVSAFERSLAVLKSKAKELMMYGYVN